MKLTPEQIETKLEALDGWKLEEEKWLVKKYRFREFMDGIRFVDDVAMLAEAQNHHPFIAIDYKLVTVRITSWQAGGITDLDFRSAQSFDKAYIKLNAAP